VVETNPANLNASDETPSPFWDEQGVDAALLDVAKPYRHSHYPSSHNLGKAFGIRLKAAKSSHLAKVLVRIPPNQNVRWNSIQLAREK
jgi:hypothetical protein